ncbi:MAG: aspartoacylase [Crocosphaera sp.]
MVNKIKKVALFGGTHGNEITGVYLVKKFLKHPHLIKRSTLEVLPFFSNPKAIELKQRYVETDLNRCFAPEDLENLDTILYEQLLAKNIYKKIQENQVNFLLDLHSTTANMGLTIILSDTNPFHLQLSSYLSLIEPEIKILHYASGQKSQLLRSNIDVGITLEVGPVPQNVLDADLFIKTEKIIYHLLDYLDKYNQRKITETTNDLVFYEVFKTIDYPREQGDIIAMIHPKIQSKDYQPLAPGDPLFITFEGETITYKGDFTVYPVFINEAAYYEKSTAMCLTKKRQTTVTFN